MLYLAVGALLHVVGAQSLPVLERGVQLRVRIGLCLLGHPLSPSLIQSRIRCTAHRCQAVSQKTSSIALTSPLWVSDATSSVPEAQRSRCACKKPGHESYDSVSATDTPGTRLQPDSSQPMAVATAVDATRFHLT